MSGRISAPRSTSSPPSASILGEVEPTFAGSDLSATERRTVRRFVALLGDALGSELRAVWLYGSRARGEGRPESDVDLLVIAEGDTRRNQRLALDLSETAALEADESPFLYSVQVRDGSWLRDRREIGSFFIGEVDRDKLVLAGGSLEADES
jgi:predicted nucleotidyltransferase